MSAYLLDTSACIEAMRERSAPAARRITRVDLDEAIISVVVLAELELGVELSAVEHRAANRHTLDDFLDCMKIVDWTQDAARQYAVLRAELKKRGKLIGPLDMLVAAHALALGLPLMTGNAGEFKRVPGLKVLALPKS